VNSAFANGVVIVAAAGNNSNDIKYYPAALENVIAVAATDAKDERASFSNFGDWVSVAAPGLDVLSTTLGGGYKIVSGTSISPLHVACLASWLFV